jgi:hypothetical protein
MPLALQITNIAGNLMVSLFMPAIERKVDDDWQSNSASLTIGLGFSTFSFEFSVN